MTSATVVVVQERAEEVLERQELVAAAPRLADGEAEACSRALATAACSGLLHAAAQRELVLARERLDLRDLGLGDLARVDAGDADAVVVDVQHDLRWPSVSSWWKTACRTQTTNSMVV